MKPGQKMGIVFTIVGLVAGAASYALRDATIAVAVSIALYAGVMFLSSKKIETSKNIKWILGNSIGCFLLTWVVSWIVLFNLW